jgi:glycosyltransferase involved in cell wall biosynthesis
VFCAVLDASHADLAEAEARGVTLLSIERSPESASYDRSWAYDVWKRLQEQYPDQRIDWWVGHDVVSGEAAIEGPLVAAYGHTAVIMHMSYIDYAGMKHSSGVNAVEKEEQQRQIFTQAHKHFAVGPLLRDAMRDMVDSDVTMLVPGFATIPSKPSTARLTLITFGRMDRASDCIKQGSLAVAGFASACRQAHAIPGLPSQLRDNPQMRVIGIAEVGGEEERQLRQLAQAQAGRALNILAQPFTAQREPLFDQLGRADLALMLSWHEGFGLPGWEAIAAQVPLIVSRQSGLYSLVQESIGDPGIACLKVLDIQGQEGDDDSANFTEEDEAHVRDAILEMVRDMGRWQQNAASLKGFLADKLVCAWEHTARQFCEALGIEVNTPPVACAEGLSEPAPTSTHRPEIIPVKTETTVPGPPASTLIQIPHLEWSDALKEDVPDRFLLLPASGGLCRFIGIVVGSYSGTWIGCSQKISRLNCGSWQGQGGPEKPAC